MGTVLIVDHHLPTDNLNPSRRVDELGEERLRSGVGEPLQATGQMVIQEGSHHGQRQIEIHVEANFAGKAVEVKEGDLLSEPVLDVVTAGVRLNQLPAGQRFR